MKAHVLFYVLQEGRGLHSTLNLHSKKFIGILNGIDTDTWNPATDTYLKIQYTANDLQGKAENKEAMRRHLGLSSADVRKPLVILFYQMFSFVMRRHHHVTLSLHIWLDFRFVKL
jgi:glycogen synthase